MFSIPLARPEITEEDIDNVSNVLKSGMLVQGKEVLQLEKSIASYVGSKEAIAVSNGTASLHLSLIALGVGPGDEVVVPAFSYIATANVVELVGAKPIFVDITLDTFNIDTSKIEKNISSRTKAIIPVHEFGLPCDITEIVAIAKKNNLFVIEDSACGLGSTEKTQFTGSFGNTGSFSFHPRKAITSGEGGIITTSDKVLATKIRTLRNHGVSIENQKVEFSEAGFNYRLTDIQASLLNSQFRRFSKQLEKKREIVNYYLNHIKNRLVTLPETFHEKTHSWQTFHILIDKRLNRDKVIDSLNKNGIGTNYGAQCIPYTKYYQNKYGINCKELFPKALCAYKHGLAIPLYESLQKEEIKYIVQEINNIEL